MTEQLRVEIVAEAGHEDDMNRARAALLDQEVIQVDFAGRDLWMVAHDVVDKGPDAGVRFTATIQDMDTGRLLRAVGYLDEVENASLLHTSWQRPPNDEEFAWAVALLENDDALGPAIVAGEVVPYRPMPPLANRRDVDGNVDRVVAVGLRSAEGHHRIVGVRTIDGEVIPEPEGVPGPSEDDCGAPGVRAAPAVAGPRQARVRVWRGDDEVWSLLVVRPAASSGTNGSGVELRAVDYRGGRVLHRAHLPILNVEFGAEGVAAGVDPAYRLWAHEEGVFEATGEDAVTGFRLCAEPPRTILDTGAESGDFRGVAVWVDGDDLVVVSQLEAGPYRHVNEWRLSADGTIRPRLGFVATANAQTCKPHVHHAYWRLDFDILAPESNVIREYNDPGIRGETRWHSMRFEAKRSRDPARGRFWRIRHDRDGRDYSINPGPADGTTGDGINGAGTTGDGINGAGTAGDFGAGDVWILRFDPEQIDDGQGFTTDPSLARAGLDRFLSGRPVQSRDLVVWYGVHVRHGPDEDPERAADRVGPDLVAGHWNPRTYAEPELLADEP
ncbi:MAG: hypothetical protein M3066_10210 [Actinomycetota bacterium]|nr:hypothetical protein [Actinomycetota bacterium]